MRTCPKCGAELDEVYSAPEPGRDLAKHLAPGQLKYACPDCDREWRVSDEGSMVPFA